MNTGSRQIEDCQIFLVVVFVRKQINLIMYAFIPRSSDIYSKHSYTCIQSTKRVVSYIPKFGDASKSPVGDAVVSHWRCIISFRDAHPPHSHPHLQSAGYVTLLSRKECNRSDWIFTTDRATKLRRHTCEENNFP
jgi:hypothetical protein